MRVDVTDLVGADSRVLNGERDGFSHCVGVGSRDVVSVLVCAKADDLGVNFRAARLGVLVLFQD